MVVLQKKVYTSVVWWNIIYSLIFNISVSRSWCVFPPCTDRYDSISLFTCPTVQTHSRGITLQAHLFHLYVYTFGRMNSVESLVDLRHCQTIHTQVGHIVITRLYNNERLTKYRTILPRLILVVWKLCNVKYFRLNTTVPHSSTRGR